MKRKWWLMIGLLVFMGTASIAATATADPVRKDSGANSRRDYLEMEKDVTWMVLGLFQLASSKERDLVLGEAQKKNILPIFRELIDRKIIILKLEDFPVANKSASTEEKAPKTNRKNQPKSKKNKKEDWGTLIQFAYAKMDQIDSFFKPDQLTYIDNLNFEPKEFGLNSSAPNNRNQESTRRKSKDAPKKQKKNRAGIEKLVKLNSEVYQMLQAK